MARVPDVIRRNPLSQVAAQPAPSGHGWAALAELAKIGAGFVRPAALEQAAEEGLKSVYRDQDGTLKVEKKSVLGGELADAHNTAAYAKYLAQKKIDLSQTFTELAQKHEFDPAGFKDASDAYIKILQEDESVPAALKEDILLDADRESKSRFNGLYKMETDRNYRDADRNTKTHRDMLVDDYVNLYMGGDMEAADAKFREIEEVSRFRENAPYISETPAERDAYLRGVRASAKVARLTQRLNETVGAAELPDDLRTEIDDVLKDPDLDPDTRRKLYVATQGRLKGIDANAIVDGLTSDSFEARASRGLASMAVGGATRPDSFSGMQGDFRASLEAMIAAAPEEIRKSLQISSGYRSNDRQAQLWQEALSKYGSEEEARKWVAPPGRSQHNHGNAADLKFLSPEAKQWVHANAARFGMAFPLANEDWHIESANARGFSAEQRTKNAAALTDAGLTVNDQTEFMALSFGVETTVAIANADPTALLKDVLPPEAIKANPILANMTARDAHNWAARKMTVKASDIALQQRQIDLIDDTEVRAMASSALNDRYGIRKRMEDAAALPYGERMSASDDTLTEQEIREDHALSDSTQTALIKELQRQRADQIAVQETIAALNDDTTKWDPYDNGSRKDVNQAYESVLGDDDPLSVQGQTLAGEIAVKTGFLPQRSFNAIRAAVNGTDPQALASAMEFTNQVVSRVPNAIGIYDGRTDVLNALADYQFKSGFMDAATAAGQMIEERSPDAVAKRKNLSDAAKTAAKNLKPSDITEFFGSRGSDVDLSDPTVQGSVMDEYERLFKDAYVETGDASLAKNRALTSLSTVYGGDEVTGSNRMMKFPPQKFYPMDPKDMRAQIEQEVSAYAFGDTAKREFFIDVFGGVNQNPHWVNADRITIMSDERTRREVSAGKAPSYQVMFMDQDEVLQLVPGRYTFDPTQSLADEETRRSDEMKALMEGQSKDGAVRNLRAWRTYFESQGLGVEGALQEVLKDKDRYGASPPPQE